jgi:threonyl-tRNA synthetase
VEELEKLAKETEFAAGYVRVRTPHLAKEKMYKTSGHLPYYADSMFPPMELHEHGLPKGDTEDESEAGHEAKTERYYLKAMNCPHHHRIFAAEPRSYRDLPLRLAEYGTCYRYEESGTLFGLMRVRALNMNDAHIYCTEEQFADEFRAVNDMYLKYFKIFGLDKYQMRFSTHGAEGLGKEVRQRAGTVEEDRGHGAQGPGGVRHQLCGSSNEAAFYGPKIDVQVWSAIGREFTIATNQVDFAVPVKFGLVYKDRDNTEKTPLCIHRAPLGTHERFIGFLIEHFAGNFPLWLAPSRCGADPG